jgi:biopolymer transport protein ExbD
MMAMSAGRKKAGPVAEINVTPMADIMIVLLIIFMVMTPLIVAAPVSLPAADNAQGRRDDRVDVVLTAAGEMRVGKTAFASAEALTAYVREQLEGAGERAPTVLVEADRDAAYADVMRVLDACRRAGAEEVGLAAKRPVGGR